MQIKAMQPGVTIEDITNNSRIVTINWDDGHVSEFHYGWLRDNCRCSACWHPQAQERLHDALAITSELAPTAVRKDSQCIMEFALENTEETLDIIMKFAENEDREHMRFMLLTEIEDVSSPLTQSNGLGWMTVQQWQEFHDSLLEHDALEAPVDVSLAFTDRFLEDAYTDGKLEWP